MNAPYRLLFTGLLVIAHPLVHPKKYHQLQPARPPSAAPKVVSIHVFISSLVC